MSRRAAIANSVAESLGPMTVLGAGRMGGAIARALIAAGHDVSVWNRTPDRCQPLVDLGARLAQSAHDAVAASPITLICVLDYDAADGVLRDDRVASALAGKVLIQLTSGTPAQAREAHDWAVGRRISYLEAYPTAFDTQIGTGESTVLYSGQKSTFDTVHATLTDLGRAVFLGESCALANAACMASVPFLEGAMLGLVQAAAFAQAEGLAIQDLHEMVLTIARDALPTMVEGVCERIANDRVEQPIASVSNNASASAMMLDTSRASGTSCILPALIASLFAQAAEDGLAGLDIAAMVKGFREPDSGREERVLARFARNLEPDDMADERRTRRSRTHRRVGPA